MLFNSSDNMIDSNSFSENDDNAVLIDSSENVIYHNNFLLKQRQAFETHANSWQANYWSDYSGLDNNEDGLGDSPYPIPGTSTSLDASPKMSSYPEISAPVPSQVPAEFRETPWQGHWIKENTIWENSTIELKGWVMIESGTSLTINNCKLLAASLNEGVENVIFVKSGGSLYVYRSTIGGDKFNSYFKIRTEKGGTIVIQDSKIYYAGDWGGNAGIQLCGDGAVIENNEILGNYTGIHIRESSNHRLVNNKISDCVDGIIIEGPSHDNIIENNNISGCLYSGISIADVTRNTVSSNRIENVLLGLGLYGAENLVRGNQIQHSSMGLAVWSSGNMLYYNNFIDNGAFSPSFGWGQGQALDSSGGNEWDYHGEGNYWSNYIGNDADGNGIGDTPYFVFPNGLDYYPLIMPISVITSVLSDVPPGYWAEDYIIMIYNAGITTGCVQDNPETPENERKYCPDAPVTREQMAAFITRALKQVPPDGYCGTINPFPDVGFDRWSCKNIKRLYELGITTGYADGRFGPDDNVTREQMAAFITRALNQVPPDGYCGTTNPFPDVAYDRWGCKNIKRLYELAITTGYGDGRFGPDDNVTRAQMAAFLSRAFLGMQ